MLPMTEPVTELTLESPAGLIRVTADCRDGKVDGRHVPERAGVRDPPRTRRSRSRTSARSTVDVAYGGMFYVIADAEPFGLRLTPDEGADIVRITEMIKAAAAEQLPVVHPGPAGVRRDHDRAAVRAGPRSGEQPAERGHRLDRDARLGAAGDLDRRDRPVAVRHRHVGQDGDAPREGRARASATRSATRASSARSSPGACSRRRTVGDVPGDRPDDHRPGLDHRLRELRRRPDRPVPRRLHGRRHLGVGRAAFVDRPRSAGRLIPRA